MSQLEVDTEKKNRESLQKTNCENCKEFRGQEIRVKGGDDVLKMFPKCGEDKPHFVDKNSAVAGETQGWRCFDDIPIQLLLNFFKLSFLLGKALGSLFRAVVLQMYFFFCLRVMIQTVSYPKDCD